MPSPMGVGLHYALRIPLLCDTRRRIATQSLRLRISRRWSAWSAAILPGLVLDSRVLGDLGHRGTNAEAVARHHLHRRIGVPREPGDDAGRERELAFGGVVRASRIGAAFAGRSGSEADLGGACDAAALSL